MFNIISYLFFYNIEILHCLKVTLTGELPVLVNMILNDPVNLILSLNDPVNLILSHLDYEGDPISNANSSLISFTVAIFQNSLHQNYGACLTLPDLIRFLNELLGNPCCLATREYLVNDPGQG